MDERTKQLISFLKNYDGKELRLMEVCGTHTAQIAKNGIPSLLSDKIRLISGPGCPVCVTVSGYIDRLIELAKQPDIVVVTFGDMLRVPGSRVSLAGAKAEGAKVRMVYSPMEILKLAEENREKKFVFAAVGFETTTPVYALLVKQAQQKGLHNIRLLTSLKTMPPVIEWLCRTKKTQIDGFLAPGHVCTVTGTEPFEQLARKYEIPFVAAGFEGVQLLSAIAALVKMQGKGELKNFYPSAVGREPNTEAQNKVDEIFDICDAAWRGMGVIPNSGRKLSDKYREFDAGSEFLMEDEKKNKACACAQILTGEKRPEECPLFGKVCTPDSPQGACMVSMEGSCFHSFESQK